jgi:acid phosphatase type 7
MRSTTLRRVLAWLLLLAVYLASWPAAAQQLQRGPYLQMATPTSIVVRWRTDVLADSVVRYGTAPGALTQQQSLPVQVRDHEVPLTGLSPNTRYYYAVGTATAALAGDDTTHFTTAPQPGTSKATRVWAVGDAGTADAGQKAVRDAFLKYTGSRGADVFLMLGDNAYNDGTDAEYQKAVFDIYGSVMRQTPLWPTRGNHERDTSVYYGIFTMPANAEAGGSRSGTEAYYSFDHGNIHFVCLDSEGSSRGATGAMASWLKTDLANNTKPWVIAYWHHPPYTKGSHNSDTEAQLKDMREVFVPILEAGGVDLVLSGHSHSYERSYLIDGHYGVSNTFTASMKKDGGSGRENDIGAYKKPAGSNLGHFGAVYAVAGSSGKLGGGSLNHPAMFVSLNRLGSVVIDVDGDRLVAKFLRENGTVDDSFTMVKGDAPPPTGDLTPPTAPGTLTAQASSAASITLAWQPASDNVGVTGYRVHRDGNLVTTTGGTALSYTDTGLSAATTYNYAAYAIDAAGNVSPASNTASAATLPGATSAQYDITSMVLVNASNGAILRTLAANDTLSLGNLGAPSVSIQALANEGAKSVKFVSAEAGVSRTEGKTPWAFLGNSGSAYSPWKPAVKTYSITATGYSASGASGTAGKPMTITVNVIP